MGKVEKSPAAKELQREYLRSWRKRNPDKVKAYNRSYWERKAKKSKEKACSVKSERTENYE